MERGGGRKTPRIASKEPRQAEVKKKKKGRKEKRKRRKI